MRFENDHPRERSIEKRFHYHDPTNVSNDVLYMRLCVVGRSFTFTFHFHFFSLLLVGRSFTRNVSVATDAGNNFIQRVEKHFERCLKILKILNILKILKILKILNILNILNIFYSVSLFPFQKEA